MNHTITQLFTVLIMLAALTPSASARTEVTNNVSATANTGGNTAGAGETVVEGEARAHIFVETTVNSETVQYVDEHTTGADGASARLEHTSTVIQNGGTTTVAGTTTGETDDEHENNKESRRSFLTIITSFFVYVRNIFTF